MDKRNIIQDEALRMSEKYNNLIINWATGTGKSKATIDIIKTIKGPILLVVDKLTHKDNWRKEFIKFRLSPSNITITTYASLHKYSDKTFEATIYDEAHHLNTEKRLAIAKTIKQTKAILLSASLKDSAIRNFVSLFPGLARHEIKLNTAIEEGYLPNPQVVLVPTTLDDKEKNQLIEVSIGKPNKVIHTDYNGMWQILKNRKAYENTLIKVACTELDKYAYLNNQIDYRLSLYRKYKNPSAETMWLRACLDRKNFLASTKLKHIKPFLEKLKTKRFICFTNSIDDMKKLSSKNHIHSKLKNPSLVLNKFNSKKINNIFAVGMLQEGENLTDIEVGVISQLDGSERPFIQKFGRTLRSNYPLLFIFYTKNTQDVIYMKNVIENTPNECIININDYEKNNINSKK